MPGMLGQILKNLFSRPVTTGYPHEPKTPFRSARGTLILDIDKCIVCGACEKACPAGAIEVKPKEHLYKYDPYSCIVCGNCVEACPTGCFDITSEWRKPVEKMETMVWEVKRDRERARRTS